MVGGEQEGVGLVPPPPAPAAVHTGGIKRVGAVAAVATAGERAVRLAFEPSVTYAAGSQARAPPHKAPTAARAAGTVSATSLSWSGEFTHESKLLYGDYQKIGSASCRERV